MRITVDVKAEARQEGVEELGEGVYIVRVKAPRRKGKANKAVLRLLRRHFGHPVHIVSGLTSNKKIVEVKEPGEYRARQGDN